VASGPYLHSIKRASEADLGSILQSSGRTPRHRKDSGNVAETFLLVETLTRGQQVYQVLHLLHDFQTSH
jgi:hypothetical protein